MNKKTIREGTKLQSIIRSIRGDEAMQLRIARGTKRYTINVDVAELDKYTPLPIDEV